MYLLPDVGVVVGEVGDVHELFPVATAQWMLDGVGGDVVVAVVVRMEGDSVQRRTMRIQSLDPCCALSCAKLPLDLLFMGQFRDECP